MLLSQLARAAGHENGRPRVASSTLAQYESTGRKLIAYLDDVDIAELDAAAVHAWDVWLAGGDIRTTTANCYRRTARAMFNRIKRQDLAGAIRLKPEPRRRSKAMSDDDLAAILAHANVRDAAMILLMADSGCRRGAIPRIRRGDLKIWSGPDGRFRVAVRVREKGEHERLIFARHDAGMALSLWLAIRPHDTAHVFTNLRTGDPLTADAITGIYRKLRIAAGIPADRHVSPHALRHRFAHNQLSRFDAKVVSQWLGHASVETTLDIYGHRTEEELEKLYFGDE